MLIIINRCISSHQTTFTELAQEIIKNFNNINLMEYEIDQTKLNKLVESRGRKLLITRPLHLKL